MSATHTHTRGPWFSEYDDLGFFEIGSEVASLRLALTPGACDADEANARLIAAAPDLLLMLEKCAVKFRLYALHHELKGDTVKEQSNRDLAIECESVIFKATGVAV